MEEPAGQLNEGGGSAYDEPTGVAPTSPKPDLKALEGSGETGEPKHGHLREAGADSPSRSDLAGAEENPSDQPPEHENTVGQGYTGGGSSKTKSSKGQSRLSRRKKWGIGIGGGLIGGGIIGLLLVLLPALRLDGYLAGIDNRVFAAANNAVGNRVENLFEHYLRKRILTIQKCGNVVSNDCKTDYSQDGIATNLFNAWQDARIENKLFDQFGLEVQSMKKPINGQYYKIIDADGRWSGTPGTELTINEDGEMVLGKFTGGSRIFGQSWGDFISNETRWSDVMQRVSVRKYLSRAHGTKFWCLFACEEKDAIDNAKVNATTKLKLKLIERTVYPFSTKYGLILKCLTSGDASGCSPDKLAEEGLDTTPLSAQDLDDLQKIADGPEQTVSQYLIEQILLKTGVDEVTAKEVTGAIPVAGQIYLGLSAVDTLEQAKNFITSGALSKIAASITSAQYVEYYQTMRSADDEIKSGSLPLDDVGALNSQFDYNNQPAEQSLVYQAYNNPKPTTASATSNSLISSILGGHKILADTTSPAYACANGQPIPVGQLVCPEKTLNNRSFKIENYFKDASWITSLLTPYETCYGFHLGVCVGVHPSYDVHQLLGSINWLISNTLGTILSTTLSAMKAIPGLNYLMSQLTSAAANIINDLFQEVFPLPVQPTSPGRDRYDGLEAGGEITASEFNKGGYTSSGQSYGLGGQLLTNQQQSDASQAYLNQQNYDFNHQSIIARLTNTNNASSPLSRFVAAMPTTWNEFSSNVFSFISNPFKSFSVIWHPAYAVTNTAAINAFGVPRFGYAANDPVFNADPSVYTPQYCQQLEQKWQATKTQDPTTGIDEYSTTNPCLLEQVSVESASAAFTGNESLDQ